MSKNFVLALESTEDRPLKTMVVKGTCGLATQVDPDSGEKITFLECSIDQTILAQYAAAMLGATSVVVQVAKDIQRDESGHVYFGARFTGLGGQ